jgi:hypothetical protein
MQHLVHAVPRVHHDIDFECAVLNRGKVESMAMAARSSTFMPLLDNVVGITSDLRVRLELDRCLNGFEARAQ